APAATSAVPSSTAVASFSLMRETVFNAPSAKAATFGDRTAIAACPRAIRVAALTVLDTTVTGTEAEAASGQAAAARSAAGPSPRRTRRARNSERPRSRRSFKVDFAIPSCVAPLAELLEQGLVGQLPHS